MLLKLTGKPFECICGFKAKKLAEVRVHVNGGQCPKNAPEGGGYGQFVHWVSTTGRDSVVEPPPPMTEEAKERLREYRKENAVIIKAKREAKQQKMRVLKQFMKPNKSRKSLKG